MCPPPYPHLPPSFPGGSSRSLRNNVAGGASGLICIRRGSTNGLRWGLWNAVLPTAGALGCWSDPGEAVAVPAALEAGPAEPSAGGPAKAPVPPALRVRESRPSLDTTQFRGPPPSLSVGTLKKQLLQASQLIREKINDIEGTKLDDHFLDLERKIDITNKAVTEILLKATEYIQPNPACRAKLGMLSPMLKIHNQRKASECLQPEGLLGDCMLKYGQELGKDSTFAQS